MSLPPKRVMTLTFGLNQVFGSPFCLPDVEIRERRRPNPVLAVQFDHRDLAAHAETRRRSPVAGAPAYVQQHVADAMQPGHDRLEPANDQIERKELSAMSVS